MKKKQISQDERTEKAKALGAKFAVFIEEDNKTIFLKEPTREVYKAWYSLYGSDPSTANETVVRTLIIKEVSDTEVLNDYKALASVFPQLSEIMALKKSSLRVL